MVFQHFNLFPHLTILENITIAQTKVRKVSKAEAEARAVELLKRVGLEHKAHDYPARAPAAGRSSGRHRPTLAMEPKIILFDEPTSALTRR